MKLQFTILAFLLSMLVFSQSGGQTTNSQEISTKLPILAPQTPTTADLGKYGEVLVNESTGAISPSIPLLDYYAGNINIPIALQYSGNGVKINQDPTWTGINWNLNPSGVITRVVKDKPDEATATDNRMYYSTAELNALPGAWQFYGTNFSTQTVWHQKLIALNTSNVDTEVDIFNYNFLGYSGSFYMDIANNVHLIKYDKEIEITFLPNSELPNNGNNKSSFLIKLTNGDMYYFGGPNASESSKSWTNIGAGSTAGIPYTQNAFYLYQISFLNGGTVNFEYTQNGEGGCSNKIGIQELYKKSSNYSDACIYSFNILNNDVENSVSLKKISSSFNNQYVDFEVSVVNQCAGITKLSNVFLKDSNDAIIKKVNLGYSTMNVETLSPSKNKFFLTNVSFFNSANQFEHDYELTYNSPELLPKKDSFAQDELGNYNGKTSNTTLIPLTNDTFLNNSCNNLADREASPFYASIGSLVRIKYPTGGYTDFEYELPFKGLKEIYLDHNITNVYGAPNSGYTTTDSQPTISGEFKIYTLNYYPDQGDGPLVVTTPTTITGTLEATVIGSITNHSRVQLYAIRSSMSGPYQEILIDDYPFPNTENTTVSYSVPFSINLGIGNYSFKLVIKRHNSSINNTIITHASFDLPTNTFTNTYYPGLRVKRVKSYDNNANVQITRYYYNTLLNRNIESYEFNPNYYYVTRQGEYDVYNLTANSVVNTFHNDIGKYVYEYVTISNGGDNFENGGKEMRFYKNSDQTPIDYVTLAPTTVNSLGINYSSFVNAGTNQSYINSVLAEETIYNSSLLRLKKVNYIYEGIQDATIGNIKIYSFANESNIYLSYDTKSYKHRLKRTETRDYFQDQDNPITTIVTNTYSPSKVSLPSTIETTTSLGEAKKINLYYPSDTATIGNLSDTDIAKLNMLQNTKHNVAEIVKTESLIAGNLVDSKQVTFNSFGSKILPSLVKTRKGFDVANILEDRIEFTSYNAYGKPSLLSLKNGGKIYYMYNNKQQVILKIESDAAITVDDNIAPSGSPCYYQNMYPLSMVTQYNYDPLTNNLISIIDPKCDVITYEYDTFNRLKIVKDSNGNILSENQYHFKY